MPIISALQTPPGKFQFTGEIKQDFSIFINDAYGKLGQSEVTGTYYQKWNPAKYRFLLNGSCYPPDIDNWLGIWWPPLWQDFTFLQPFQLVISQSKEFGRGNLQFRNDWPGKNK